MPINLDIFFNSPGDEKRLKCSKCGKFTIHVLISSKECLDEDSKSGNHQYPEALRAVVGTINDVNPLMSVLIGHPARCTECGRVRTTKLEDL